MRRLGGLQATGATQAESLRRLRGARGPSAHACSTGLSTGCRLMLMTARCNAAAICRGATTVRVAAHETSGGKVMAVWIAQSACSCSRMRNSWQSRPRHVHQCVPHNQPTPCMRCSIRSTQSAAGSAGATVWIATSFRLSEMDSLGPRYSGSGDIGYWFVEFRGPGLSKSRMG